MINNEIAIRAIQHYMYCPHRWGLLEIDQDWAENAFVVKANIMHKRVHDDIKYVPAKGRTVINSIRVYNDDPDYNLYGVIDSVEIVKKKDGTECFTIVEYKPTKPKNREYNDDDLMQVFAQKICLDYIFGCDCDGYIYYSDVRKRVKLPLKENYKLFGEKLKEILKEMRLHLVSGNIPGIIKGQKCSGCSMKDLCMPKISLPKSIRSDMMKIIEVSNEKIT